MFVFPRPRSSQLATRAPALLTLDVAEWNFGASARERPGREGHGRDESDGCHYDPSEGLAHTAPFVGGACEGSPQAPLDTDHEIGSGGAWPAFQPMQLSSGDAEPQETHP